MTQSLPEPVERVSAFVREAGAEARIQQFPEGTHTAQDAADAVGCELDAHERAVRHSDPPQVCMGSRGLQLMSLGA